MSLDAPVYGDLDRLAASGLIDSIVLGIRPYTRVEVVRLLHEAQNNLGRLNASGWAKAAIDADLARYDRTDDRPIDAVRVEATYLRSPFRLIPPDSNGSVDATINPLAAYREGRTTVNGGTAALETEHALSLGRHAAVSLAPRVVMRAPRGGVGASGVDATMQRASLSMLFGNLVVDAGRDAVVFGPALTGGLMLSANATPLDMVRITTQRPARLPSFLGVIGPVAATLFVADLGTSHQTHDHAKLVGYHIALHPHPTFELGVEILDETGGRGAPPASFGDRMLDAVPILDALRTGSDFLFSNKLAGIDGRWRVPGVRGMTLYAEGVVDDLDGRRLRSSIFEDGGMIGGMSLACVLECGRLDMRAEFRQTGIRYYTHTDFASGLQNRGELLGDPLGPRGLGGYVSVSGDANRVGRLTFAGAFEVRSGNRYASAGGANHAGDFHFVLVERHPGEERTRAVGSWRVGAASSRATPVISLGAERVNNAEFVSGRKRTNFLGSIAYEIRP